MHRPPSRGLRLTVAGVLAATVGVTVIPLEASAAVGVPTFPDNLVVFPNRDFITVEGYQDHIGETATIEVTRPGVGIVGSAAGVVAEGDVAFEINHPGGYCWGAGTGLNVTPDILPGDVASIRFGDVPVAQTTVQDAYVNADAVQSGTTVTVTGHIGPTVNRADVEQRIVEPALTDTVVTRRDVRALPGPLTPAARGGYQSALAFSGDTFTATYIFDDAETARIAANAGLGERLLSWEETDVDGNRQGLTIAEYGEPGGPGMGGCPNGPLQSGPPAPTGLTAAKVEGGVKLSWTPAATIPGTPAITGYRATAVSRTSAGGEQVEIGRRITGQAARGTTITGLSATEDYDIEVVSVSSVGLTFPAAIVQPQTDTTPPTVSASLADGSYPTARQVTLTANELGSEIYYTTDGTDPVLADVLANSALLYTGPINIVATSTLKFVAFDLAGNISAIGQRSYTITNTPTPNAPTFGTSAVGPGQVTMNWTATDPSITGFGVQVFDAAGAEVGNLRETTATTLTITGLAGDTEYFFTVRARNVNGYGEASTRLGPLTPQGAVVANAGPDRLAVARNTIVTLTGAGSTAPATYAWTQLATGTSNPIAANDPDRVNLTLATTLNPRFTVPLYRAPMTNKGYTFRLTVTTASGSKTDTVLVTPSVDRVTITTARWKAGDFRVSGSGSFLGATVIIHAGSPTGPVLTTAAVVAAAAPAIGEYEVRLRNGAAPAANPGVLYIESNQGGTFGPFTVS
ncbi:fibronectin type III domain-containing protein [Actinoplanes solisilvae]|uniref:fibronectin type III domain-containing protein n=1 Tax=Actinoplanes solisilvae TaxID=2486853 RepID=UPI000FD9C445|nr:fibronectin type III domain-containing protein [Actinoplanes solisilvae]